jgi:hypothetical protein
MKEEKKAEILEEILKGEIEELPKIGEKEKIELKELSKLVQEIKKLSTPSPSSHFKKELLKNLLSEMKGKLSLWKKALLFAATFAFILVGTATASLKSLPDSPLYPLKRVIEKAELILARNKVTKEKVILKQAQERLKEAKIIESKNPGKAKELREEARKNIEKVRKGKALKKGKSQPRKLPQNQGINKTEREAPPPEAGKEKSKIKTENASGENNNSKSKEGKEKENLEKNSQESDTNSGENR